MKRVFPPEWRTQNRAKRRFYARYMTWLERGGYTVVVAVFAAFIFAFNYPVEDVVKADKVALTPETVNVQLEEPAIVLARLVEDGAEVEANDPVLRVLVGEEAIARYHTWLSQPTEAPPFTERDVQVVGSPASGTFRAGGAQEVAPGEALARIVNYANIEATAELEGNTVAQAKAGQDARITALEFPAAANTLLRARSPYGDLVSSQIIGPNAKAEIEKGLVGKGLKLRDDIPLRITSVERIEIDAHASLADRDPNAGSAIPADPLARETLAAEVVSGEHKARVQLASLPPDVRERAVAAIQREAQSRAVRLGVGEKSLKSLTDVGLIAHLEAKDGEAVGGTLSGTAVSRKFVAKIRIKSPPESLLAAVRRADEAGKTVTGRVELVTGTRPIALLLLRRS